MGFRMVQLYCLKPTITIHLKSYNLNILYDLTIIWDKFTLFRKRLEIIPESPLRAPIWGSLPAISSGIPI